MGRIINFILCKWLNNMTKMTSAEAPHSKKTRATVVALGVRMTKITRITSERPSSRTIKSLTKEKRAGLCTIL